MPTKIIKPKKPQKSGDLNKRPKTMSSSLLQPISKFKAFKKSDITHLNTMNAAEITMNLAVSKGGNWRPTKLVKNFYAENPTFKQLKEFLISKAAIQILKKSFVNGVYVCVDFATDLHNLAEKNGIRCGLVDVIYTHGGGHVMVAFNVKGKGLVFVDFTQLSNYDLDAFLGKPTKKNEDDFFKIVGRKHYATPSENRKVNIQMVTVTW